MAVERKRLTIHYSGRVQGVGFRMTAVHLASGLPVTGYVLNLPDEQVRLVAEGEEKDLLALRDRVRGSHLFRGVTREDVSWSPATGEWTSFGIRYAD